MHFHIQRMGIVWGAAWKSWGSRGTADRSLAGKEVLDKALLGGPHRRAPPALGLAPCVAQPARSTLLTLGASPTSPLHRLCLQLEGGLGLRGSRDSWSPPAHPSPGGCNLNHSCGGSLPRWEGVTDSEC